MDERKALPMAPDADMTANPPTTEPVVRSPAAERMRLHRERQRRGLRCFMIELRDSEIDALIRYGLLPGERRKDKGAIIRALYAYLDRTLGALQ